MVPFDGVVFDLDGTLVDTAPDLHAHLNQLLAELGRPGLSLAEVRPMIGDGARVMIRRSLEASGGLPDGVELDALFGVFLRRYAADPVRLSAVYDGAVGLLDQLAAAGVRLGMCTNKAQLPTDRLLAELGLDRYFAAVIGGDALPVRKPHAGHLEAVLQRLDVAPRRAVLVGDSENDVLAARAAGVPCVLVSFGYTRVPATELGADLVIDHLDEVVAALAALGGARA